MMFIVLARNKYGLREACYVNGGDIAEVMRTANEWIMQLHIYPEVVTLLPIKGERLSSYLFAKDPETDAELMNGYLRNEVYTVNK